MKRTPLKRWAPLRRKKWLRARSPRRIANETPAEREHKALIRQARVCVFRRYDNVGRCRGPLQAAHFGVGGAGLKHGTWRDSALACVAHHDQWDGRQKPSVFDALSREEREAIADDLIFIAREFVAGRLTESA